MEWLNDNEIDRQKSIVLRLYSPEDEPVLLEFRPLRESDEPEWDPMPEDWSCYPELLNMVELDMENYLSIANELKNYVDHGYDECFR